MTSECAHLYSTRINACKYLHQNRAINALCIIFTDYREKNHEQPLLFYLHSYLCPASVTLRAEASAISALHSALWPFFQSAVWHAFPQ